MNNQEELHIVDIASGAGHLSATVKEVLPEIAVMHHLIEVDPVLSRVSVHLANFRNSFRCVSSRCHHATTIRRSRYRYW